MKTEVLFNFEKKNTIWWLYYHLILYVCFLNLSSPSPSWSSQLMKSFKKIQQNFMIKTQKSKTRRECLYDITGFTIIMVAFFFFFVVSAHFSFLSQSVNFCIAKGSVLRPFVFSIYACFLSDIVHVKGFNSVSMVVIPKC